MSQEQLLIVKELSFSYGSKSILTQISFGLAKGEILGIIGPNGGGKSTLLKILAGLLKKESGTIRIEGEEISVHNQLFSYVPQTHKLNDILPVSVRDLISYSGATHDLLEVIKRVGLKGKEDRLISTLSGGERQRVLLAKALSTSPKILLLDEPTTGLDMNGQDQLIAILKKIQSESVQGIIIVDHNLPQLISMCNKILCLNNTSHWHNDKKDLTPKIISKIYHCEFEHLLLHENPETAKVHHHQCSEHGPHVHKEGEKE